VKEPTPVLKEDQLYIGDNGRIFCGRPLHAGATALYTGRDLSGQKLTKITKKVRDEFALLHMIPECEECKYEQQRNKQT